MSDSLLLASPSATLVRAEAVDWERAEELYEAMASQVGTAGSKLRAYQASAILNLRQAYSDGARRIMLQIPTGGGKTLIASTVAAGLNAVGRRVLFVVPAIELIDQTVRKFYEAGIYDIGVMQADHPMTNATKPIQIASVQTLMRRELAPADLVFLDEAHRDFAYVRRWMLAEQWRDIPFIGLSATPWTKGLGAYYDAFIIGCTAQSLIDQKYLSPFVVFAPAHPDLTGVRTVGGDYDEGDLAAVMDRPPLIADVVEEWHKRATGRPTLVFAVNRAHAEHLAQRFREHGVSVGYVDCFTPTAERKALRHQFATGEIRVVCNVGVLTTGVDWDVRCIVLARPTKSEMLYVQMIGRGLRMAKGKDHCVILDHSDNTLRLGFITEIHHEELDDGRSRRVVKRDRVVLPKTCPQCAYLREPSIQTCPNCGFVAEPVNKIVHQAGQLWELRSDKTPIVEEHATPRERERRDLAGLKWIARERGYDPGWVYHKFVERFGHPPTGLDPPPHPPTDELRNWEKSRRIAWAKRRAKLARMNG
jgi:DNA repair protein RadD